jgi:glycosyltransferase involved in cell wall biosynthesis
MTPTDVTIVVCTYNRAELLRDTLESLAALDTGGEFRYELVVVDNASTDNTAAVIAEAARGATFSLRGVHEPRAGVSFARNRGIQEAASPWIAFFDDDQVADPHWLRELMAMAREKNVRCVGGANHLRLPHGDERDLSAACRELLGASVTKESPYRYSRKRAPGCGNLLIQKSVFDEVGTFDEALVEAGEDADLYRRVFAAKIEAWYTPKAISYHVIPAYRLKESYLRWKSLRHGGHIARRNWQDWGSTLFVFVLLARLIQALGVNLPRLLIGKMRHAADQVQQARCLLWKAEGYVRFSLFLLAPKLFPQRAFFSQLEFRAERHTLAHG